MKTTTRLRAFRFLSERYMQRERAGYLAELFLFGVIITITTWPMISLAEALATMR
jgi:hypothetical protein